MRTLFFFLATVALWVLTWLCAVQIDEGVSHSAQNGFFVFVALVSGGTSLGSLAALINKISYW